MAKGKTTADVVDVLNGIFSNTSEITTRLNNLEKKAAAKPSMSDLMSPAKKVKEVQKKKEGGISDVISVIRSTKDIDAKDVIKFSLLPFGLISKKLTAFTQQLSKINAKNIKDSAEIVNGLINIIKTISTTGLVQIYKGRMNLNEMKVFYLGDGKDESGLIKTLSDISEKITASFKRVGAGKLKDNIADIEKSLNSMSGIVDKAKKLGIFSRPAKALAKVGLKTVDEVSSEVADLATKLVKKAKGLGEKVKEGVLPIAKFTLMSSLIVFAAAGIGAMFVMKPKTMLFAAAGLAAIAITSLAIAGLGILINKIASVSKKHTKSVLPIVAFVGASALIVLAATGVGMLVKEHIKEAFIGLGGIVVTVAAVAGIAWLVDKVKGMTIKGLLGFLPIFGIAAMSSLMLLMTVGVGEYATKHGGWKNLGNTLGQIGTIIGAYSLVAAAAMAAMPYAWLGLAGFVPIALVATAAIGITKETASLGEHIAKAGGRAGMEKIVNDITGTLKLFTEGMTDALSGIDNNRQLRKAATTLKKLMNPVSRFTDILSKFEVTEDGKIKILHFDKDGKETAGNVIDIPLVGNAIATGFTTFSDTILKGLADAATPEKGRKKIRLIRKVMDPVSRFVDIVSKFDATPDGKLSVLTLNEKGEVKGKRIIDITKVASIISTSFITFSDKILDGLSKAANPSKGKRKIKLINKVMDPISKFTTMVNEMTDANGNLVSAEFDEDGKITKKTPIDLSKSADAIVNGMLTFTNKLNDGIGQMDQGLFEKSGFLGLGKTKLNEITSMLSDAIDESLEPYKKLDEGKLDKVLTTLNEKHISYIDKLSEAIQKTKTPMREYIDEMKELTDSYSKLQPFVKDGKQLILTVDRHEENNNNVNIDKNGFSKLYEDVVPMIESAVSTAVTKALGDLALTVPKDMGSKGGTITTSVG